MTVPPLERFTRENRISPLFPGGVMKALATRNRMVIHLRCIDFQVCSNVMYITVRGVEQSGSSSGS